jgi:chromosome segregation ATPase
MTDEISLDEKAEKVVPEEERGLFSALEEKIGHLLKKYEELVRERDELAAEVNEEKEKRIRLEKNMDLLSQDREKVKIRIDQLLHRLRSIDL